MTMMTGTYRNIPSRINYFRDIRVDVRNSGGGLHAFAVQYVHNFSIMAKTIDDETVMVRVSCYDCKMDPPLDEHLLDKVPSEAFSGTGIIPFVIDLNSHDRAKCYLAYDAYVHGQVKVVNEEKLISFTTEFEVNKYDREFIEAMGVMVEDVFDFQNIMVDYVDNIKMYERSTNESFTILRHGVETSNGVHIKIEHRYTTEFEGRRRGLNDSRLAPIKDFPTVFTEVKIINGFIGGGRHLFKGVDDVCMNVDFHCTLAYYDKPTKKEYVRKYIIFKLPNATIEGKVNRHMNNGMIEQLVGDFTITSLSNPEYTFSTKEQ